MYPTTIVVLIKTPEFRNAWKDHAASPCSMAFCELRLSNTGAHDPCRRLPTCDNLPCLIHKLRTTPFLVCQSLHTMFALFPLDALDVSCSPTLCVLFCKKINAERVAMEPRQCYKLPTITHLRKV